MERREGESIKKGLGISTKLYLGFFCITFLTVLLASIITVMTLKTEQKVREQINYEFPILYNVNDVLLNVHKAEDLLSEWSLTNDTSYINQVPAIWKNILAGKKNNQSKVEQYDNPQFKRNWEEGENAIDQFLSAQKEMVQLVKTNPENAKQYLRTTVTPAYMKVQDIFDGPVDNTGNRVGGLNSQVTDYLESMNNNTLHDMKAVTLTIWFIVLLVVVLAFFISFFLVRGITIPLFSAIGIAKGIATGERGLKIKATGKDETATLLGALEKMQVSIMENEEKIKKEEEKSKKLLNELITAATTFRKHSNLVASGDLTQRLKPVDNEIMQELGKELNNMTEGLANVTKNVVAATQAVFDSVEQVKKDTASQSSGITEQASSINEITASLGEIEKTSSQTLEKAKMLGALATQTCTQGQQGLQVVEQSRTAMSDIRSKVQQIAQTIVDLNNQTQQISKITDAVNNLARQSKILALNASIEAAKAGKAGKGFAVVAAEVKNLAEQSEQSTQAIQKILEDIRLATERALMVTEEGTKGVDQGASLVEKAGESIHKLDEAINETNKATQQIEAAISQETVGIEQITLGMNEINQVSTHFVENIKQTQEVMEHLTKIAKDLKKNIATYKI